MLHADQTVTVYNHAVINHWDIWYRTVIENCSVRLKVMAAITDSGIRSATSAIVRIPVSSPGSGYLPESEWKALPDQSAAWTLQKADLLLIGEGVPLSGGIADLKQKYGASRVFVINGYSDNRRGSPCVQHWRIDAS